MNDLVMGSGKDDPADDPSFMKVVRHFLRTSKVDKGEPEEKPSSPAKRRDHNQADRGKRKAE